MTAGIAITIAPAGSISSSSYRKGYDALYRRRVSRRANCAVSIEGSGGALRLRCYDADCWTTVGRIPLDALPERLLA